jgi:hypothetical protein
LKKHENIALCVRILGRQFENLGRQFEKHDTIEGVRILAWQYRWIVLKPFIKVVQMKRVIGQDAAKKRMGILGDGITYWN